MASVILQMLGMKMGDVESFPFVDPPDRRMISDGFKLLEELGAVDSKRILTDVGRILTRFQVDPRLARMIIAGKQHNCLREILVIVSASVFRTRERDLLINDKPVMTNTDVFWHKESDFLSFVNLWNYYEEKRQELSQGQLRKLCSKEFLGFMRMREWRDIHRQLRLVCREMKYQENTDEASYPAVHKALLAGLLSHIANVDDDRQYLGARNRKLRLFPGSSLFKSLPNGLLRLRSLRPLKSLLVVVPE